MESEYPELTFTLSLREAESYRLDLRFQKPGSPVEIDPAAGQELTVRLDPAEYKPLEESPEEYGRKLSQALFASPPARDAFRLAQNEAISQGGWLRMRLLISPDAFALHQLHWETLYDPDGKAPLFENKVLFSRYLQSASFADFKLHPHHQLRALVAVSNPSDLDAYSLEPVRVDEEINRARQALQNIEIEVIGGAAGPVTLNGLADRMRQGHFDILYMVAHGMTRKEESVLWLQDEQGETARVSAADLATEIKKLDQQPLLAVLLACESARQETNAALTAAGPLLAAAGIPAVLAMQAKISMETGARFMPVFFQDLLLARQDLGRLRLGVLHDLFGLHRCLGQDLFGPRIDFLCEVRLVFSLQLCGLFLGLLEDGFSFGLGLGDHLLAFVFQVFDQDFFLLGFEIGDLLLCILEDLLGWYFIRKRVFDKLLRTVHVPIDHTLTHIF